jgi:hypothetical protein
LFKEVEMNIWYLFSKRMKLLPVVFRRLEVHYRLHLTLLWNNRN